MTEARRSSVQSAECHEAPRREQLWDRLAADDLRNVGFAEFQRLIESFGFRLRRISGSHYIYMHPLVPRPLSLQPRNVRGCHRVTIVEFQSWAQLEGVGQAVLALLPGLSEARSWPGM